MVVFIEQSRPVKNTVLTQDPDIAVPLTRSRPHHPGQDALLISDRRRTGKLQVAKKKGFNNDNAFHKKVTLRTLQALSRSLNTKSINFAQTNTSTNRSSFLTKFL